jgi:hypothetical protein
VLRETPWILWDRPGARHGPLYFQRKDEDDVPITAVLVLEYMSDRGPVQPFDAVRDNRKEGGRTSRLWLDRTVSRF